MNEVIHTVGENMLKNMCHRETGQCCPFLALVHGKTICTRHTSLELSHRQNRARKNLQTEMGVCTGAPLFLESIEPFNQGSFNTIVYTISVEDILVDLHVTYYTYQYFSHQAEKRNMPLQDFLREMILAEIEKKKDL